MSPDRKTGTLIIVVAVALTAVTLVLTKGWGIPGVSLYLLEFSYENDYGSNEYALVETRYVLTILILIAGYGVARYLSVIPPIFRRRHGNETKDEES